MKSIRLLVEYLFTKKERRIVLATLAAIFILFAFSFIVNAGEKDRPFYYDELASLDRCPDTDVDCSTGDTVEEAIIKLGRKPDMQAGCSTGDGCAAVMYTDSYGYGVLLTIRNGHLFMAWIGYPTVFERPPSDPGPVKHQM